VRAWVLGDFRLEIGGRAVDLSSWRSKRAAELVRALVAARRGAVHRDDLIEWLWRGAADADGRLNAAVNAARRGLEEIGGPGAWIAREGERYRLERLEWVDADAFVDRYEAARVALTAGDTSRASEALGAAMSLLRGEPYAADRYAEWAVRERARLTELAQLVRERFAAVSLDLGRHDEALLSAQEAVNAEPARESAHQLVIRAHLARGDRASALRALTQCRDALRRELGVAPSPRTEALLA
jgi:DNA-binding SARP family transcriptional activator